MRPGGYSSDPKFHVVDYAPMANGVKTITEEENKEIPVKIHRTVPKTIGFVFGSRSVPLHFSGIIARNFRIRINNFFIGSQGKKGVPGQIGCFNGQSSETVLNLGIIPHGKSGAKIIRIFGWGGVW